MWVKPVTSGARANGGGKVTCSVCFLAVSPLGCVIVLLVWAETQDPWFTCGRTREYNSKLVGALSLSTTEDHIRAKREYNNDNNGDNDDDNDDNNNHNNNNNNNEILNQKQKTTTQQLPKTTTTTTLRLEQHKYKKNKDLKTTATATTKHPKQQRQLQANPRTVRQTDTIYITCTHTHTRTNTHTRARARTRTHKQSKSTEVIYRKRWRVEIHLAEVGFQKMSLRDCFKCRDWLSMSHFTRQRIPDWRSGLGKWAMSKCFGHNITGGCILGRVYEVSLTRMPGDYHRGWFRQQWQHYNEKIRRKYSMHICQVVTMWNWRCM